MPNIVIPLNDSERMLVGDELKRLFALQDAPLGKEKLAILVEELAVQGLPCDAIVNGLRSLAKEELKTIRLSTILDASHRNVSREELNVNCHQCLRGEVTMRDEQGRRYALACSCERGAGLAATAALARWSGEGVQMSRGRALYFLPRVATEDPSKEEQ